MQQRTFKNSATQTTIVEDVAPFHFMDFGMGFRLESISEEFRFLQVKPSIEKIQKHRNLIRTYNDKIKLK